MNMTIQKIENEIANKHLPFWMGLRDEMRSTAVVTDIWTVMAMSIKKPTRPCF